MIDACSTHSSLVNVNSRATGPDITEFLHNVDKSLPFNLLESELRSCNQFRNASMPNECGVGEFHKFGYKIGCHRNIP